MEANRDDVPSSDQYQIGWICALSIELAAGLAMLDESYGTMDGQDPHDTNSYHVGRIQGHNIVIACLPDGEYGTNAAAAVATNMLRTFTNVKCGLLVGIGGGLPGVKTDLRLGDVVVSSAEGTSSGVIQFDLGKKTQIDGREQEQDPAEQFIRKGTLDRPPWTLRSALSSLRAYHSAGKNEMSRILQRALDHAELDDVFQRPAGVDDRLYAPSYVHSDSLGTAADCSLCDLSQVVTRAVRPKDVPKIFYGTVLSGNVVIKDAKERDRLRDQFSREKALCVEMEAAGLMNVLPSMIIRGICDYADSHKNDKWHGYAALAAAAFAKDLLSFVKQKSIEKEDVVDLTKISGVFEKSLEPLRTRIDDEFERIRNEEHQRKQEDERDSLSECHNQLHPGISYEETKDAIAGRAAGTCHWVLNDERFTSWREKDGADVLWVSASPGCGKSVLCKSLVDEMLTREQGLSVCYFFFRDSTGAVTLSMALCSILHQLFTSQQQLRHHALDAYRKYGPAIKQEVNVLWEILLSATSDINAEPTICVVDALDEADERSRESFIRKLCRFYADSTRASTPAAKLKFLATSRPSDKVQDDFEQFSETLPQIRLRGEDKHEQIGREIDQVVRVRVDQIARRWRLSESSKRTLEHELLTMEHRTYLWLELAIDSINKAFKYSSNPESTLVKRLPRSVDEAYEKLLSNIDVEVEEKVRTILVIIVGARQALTVGELCLALQMYERTDSFDPLHMERYMRQWCGLFIIFSQGKVYLIHQTAKDFLLCHNQTPVSLAPNSWKNSLHEANVEGVMAIICIRYLCSKIARSVTFTAVMKVRDALLSSGSVREVQGLGALSLDVVSFYIYSTAFWTSHIDASGMSLDRSNWAEILDVYLQLTQTEVPPWASAMWEEYPSKLRDCDKYPTFLAMTMGHLKVFENQIGRKGFETTARDRKGRTPLIFAAENGLQTFVDLLVIHGADLTARSETDEDALIHAIGAGHLEIVRKLLSSGSDPNSPRCRTHPLIRAAVNGELAITEMLIEHGSNVNAKGGYFGNALQAAAHYGHDRIVNALLENAALVNAEGGRYNSALQAACAEGRLDIVKLLVQHKADVNQGGGVFGSPLVAASQGTSPHREIIKILVRNGARADVSPRRLVETRFAASIQFKPPNNQEGKETNNCGADNNLVLDTIRDQLEIKPVRIAFYFAEFGEIMSVFNQHGLSPRSQGLSLEFCDPWRNLPGLAHHSTPAGTGVTPKGSTMVIRYTLTWTDPLYAACTLNDIDLVRDLSATFPFAARPSDSHIDSPLLAACIRNNEELVRLLIKKQIDVSWKRSPGRSPLQLVCAKSRNQSIVAMLLAAGADIDAFDYLNPPPLYEACKKCDLGLVDMLLHGGANVNIGSPFDSPLMVACRSHHVMLVEMLLEHGANVLTDKWETSPLALVCKDGHRRLVEVVAKRVIDMNPTKIMMWQLLCFAVKSRHIYLIKTLQQLGVDVNQVKNVGLTLLHVAAAEPHASAAVVELLLQSGGDPNAVSETQGTVTQAAVSSGNVKIVQMLHEHGANLTVQKGELDVPLHIAASRLDCDMVETLLKLGVPANSYSHLTRQTVLEAATRETIKKAQQDITVIEQYSKILRMHLEAGAVETAGWLFARACESDEIRVAQTLLDTTWPPPNVPSFTESDALETAWTCQAVGVVGMLIARNPDPQHLLIDGQTLLDAAIQGGNAKLLRAVLNAGLNVNPEQPANGPPLYQAALKRDAVKMGILLAAGSVVDMQVEFTGFDGDPTSFYGTSLHAVARTGDLQAAMRLIAAGAEISVPGQCIAGHYLCNAVEIAEHFGHAELATWFEDISTRDRSGQRDDNSAWDRLAGIRSMMNSSQTEHADLRTKQKPEWIERAMNRRLFTTRPVTTSQPTRHAETASGRDPAESESEIDWAESGSEPDWDEEGSQEELDGETESVDE